VPSRNVTYTKRTQRPPNSLLGKRLTKNQFQVLVVLRSGGDARFKGTYMHSGDLFWSTGYRADEMIAHARPTHDLIVDRCVEWVKEEKDGYSWKLRITDFGREVIALEQQPRPARATIDEVDDPYA
jgi:hypothetical protein